MIKECEICNTNNPLKRKKRIKTSPVNVLKIVYADFVFINNRYVLVVIDGFSKYLWTFIGKDQSTEFVCDFLTWIQKQLACNIQILRVDNFKSFISPKLTQHFPEMKVKTTLPNKHTLNGLAERVIKTIRHLLKKEEACFRRRNNFERRMEIVTKNYNGTKHSSTGEKPKDLIFAFSTTGESYDPEDVVLRKLKLETLQFVNNPVAFRNMKQGKPETDVGIFKKIAKNRELVEIQTKDKSIVKKPIRKIRPIKVP
uniref:Integrase catalytic domain-containing protein n=1 Tax=Strongyloides stercoralis TaxID=6248 RepID=A0A0K0E217_STRER